MEIKSLSVLFMTIGLLANPFPALAASPEKAILEEMTELGFSTSSMAPLNL